MNPLLLTALRAARRALEEIGHEEPPASTPRDQGPPAGQRPMPSASGQAPAWQRLLRRLRGK